MEISQESAIGDKIGFIKLIDSMGSDISIVNAARVSFGKRKEVIEETDKTLIRYLLKEKHSSPFEHVTFTFHVKCPLFVARQWMRHRTQSYNEISRRYTSENIEFFIPSEFRVQDKDDRQGSNLSKSYTEEKNKEFGDFIKGISSASLQTYNYLIESGVAREMARMVLPQNMYTEFYTTGNLWNILHFIDLRSSSHAQYEIMCYAKLMELQLQQVVPITLEAWNNLKG